MTTNRIAPLSDTQPREVVESAPETRQETRNTDLRALCDSLKWKGEFLRFVLEGGDLSHPTIITDVDKAIDDLNKIIEAFPDEDFKVTV